MTVIKARVRVSRAQMAVIEQMQEAGEEVTVVREGISSEPRRMRVATDDCSAHGEAITLDLHIYEARMPQAKTR